MQQRRRPIGWMPPEVPVSDGLRVLIVEEVAAAAELAMRLLVQGGITCTYLQVAVEKEFRAALLRFSPQVILSDLVLPRLDGLTALEIARRVLPDVPFIFLSATPGEERAVEAMRHGAADYVLKTNASRLVPAVLGALREVAARMRLRTYEQQTKDKEQRRHEQQQERIARLTRMLQMQSGINAAVVRIRELEDLLREACRLALQVGGYEHAMISLVASGGRSARPWYRLGMAPGYLESLEFQISDGTEPDTNLVKQTQHTKQKTISTDLTQSEPPVAGRVELLERGFHSVVALPLTVDGARIGVLSLASRESDLLSDEELRLLQDIIANLSFALQYRQKENTFQYLAYYDPLTGHAKRGLFCERLDKLLQSRGRPQAAPTEVCKAEKTQNKITDSNGRHVGDLLLQRVAERLRHHVDDDERIG